MPKKFQDLSPKRQQSLKRGAAKVPAWMLTGASAIVDHAERRRHREAKLGTFGPASEVRKIDPAEYLKEKK